MSKKIAITIAGAVSLGSYESGVAFEVLDAIAQHNEWVKANPGGERIEVDVLTGASAGGMTAAMIAQRLLFDGAAMRDPYNNPLFNAWVQEVDITGLLQRGKDEPASHSILSSNCVAAISKKYLTGRYDATPPPAVPHPALAGDGALHLGLALSNLNGVDFERPTASGCKFVYTRHADQMLAGLDKTKSDSREPWEAIRSAAVSCGAFPFAFRVQDLLRKLTDYPSDWLDKSLWGGKPDRNFTFTDGGVFQNQPLGMAKNFVDQMEEGALQADSRAYLFIAPNPKSSAQVPFTPDPADPDKKQFNSACADYWAVAKRLAGSVFDQSGYRDWIEAEKVNQKLKLLDGDAEFLQKLYASGNLAPEQSRVVSDVLLQAMYRTESDPGQAIEEARRRCRSQYGTELQPLANSPDQSAAWIDAILILERAAGLHRKEEMYIYDFVADSAKLAGNDLEAFGGFFDVRYRKHDYDYGRTVAQQKLRAYTALGQFFEGLHWTPKPVDAIDPKLDNLKMKEIDRKKREQVCDQISGAAEDLLKEIGLSWIARKPVLAFLVKPQIKKLLEL